MCQTYQTFAGPTYFLQLQLNYTYPSSSSSGIEQESLPTVSSSVNLHVSGTHRCRPLVYLHLKRSLFLQLKLYTWGPCLATGGAIHKVSPKLLDGSCGNCADW